jgi:predicted Zn-dependent peptidase
MTSQPGTAIRREQLDTGLTVALEPMPWLRSASVTLLLPSGSATDPLGEEGSATVLADWTGRGAGTLDSRGFSDAFDWLGARRGSSAGRESTSFGASLLADSLPATLKLFAEQMRSPRLTDEEFEGARELALQELASLADQPVSRLFEALTREFFLSGIGRSPYGTAEGLAALTPAAVRSDYQQRYSPHGAILAVAGGVTWEELQEAARAAFGDWRGPYPLSSEVELAPPARRHLDADTAQVQIGVAFPALAPDHADWYLQSLALGVLSGGMGSRLFSEVREKRGLVYSVGAATRAVRGFGYTIGYAGTTPEKAAETQAVMLAEFARLHEGVSSAELERARSGVLSQLVMQGESSSARSGALASDEFLRGEARPLAELERIYSGISLAQVNDYLARTSLPEPTVLTLGPAPDSSSGSTTESI